MTTPSRDDLEQRAIDYEVRLAHARVVQEQSRIARLQRMESKEARGELLWLREQYFSMLRAAGTEQEVRELGLTDEAVREARLGATVADAWQRVHRFIPPASPLVIGRSAENPPPP